MNAVSGINVTNNNQPQVKKPITQPAKTSIFYINDVHGQMGNMESLATAATAFDTFVKSDSKIDALKLAAGDILIGEDPKINKAATNFLNFIGLDATTLGNHEFDIHASKVGDFFKNIKYKIASTNIKFYKDMPLRDQMVRSYIHESNGNKYGILGIQPVELRDRMRNYDCVDGVLIDQEQETIQLLQDEVEKFREQGVNKVILLSHGGGDLEKRIAQAVDGIDVIVGGHTHELRKGVVEGENLFYSKSGAPVILTEAGKDGKYFGVLNLEFDEKGHIVKAQNNIGETGSYSRNLVLRTMNDTILGNSEVIGEVKSAAPAPDTAYVENPYADLMADAIRSELGTDLGFIQGGHMRGSIPPGKISGRDITAITPFKNRMVKYEVSEENLVEALRWGAESNFVGRVEFKPSLLQVSGLKYTVTKDGKLVEARFVDKEGQEHKIDIKNPDKNKKYTVALDDYCATNKDYPSLIQPKERFLEYYEFDKDKLVCDYIKKKNGEPFEIKCDGRITVI